MTVFVLVVEGVILCALFVSASILILHPVDLLSQARKCHNDWCCTIVWLCTKGQTVESMPAFQPITLRGGVNLFWSAANKTVANSHVCK